MLTHDVDLTLRPSRITTLTYTYCDPDTDAERTAEWTGPAEAALTRGIEILDAKRCADGRFAWYAEETGEAYLSTDETMAELGAAHIDFGLYGAAPRGAGSLYSLWCEGDFDSEAVDHAQIRALRHKAAAEADPQLAETCVLALDGDAAAYVAAAMLIAVHNQPASKVGK